MKIRGREAAERCPPAREFLRPRATTAGAHALISGRTPLVYKHTTSLGGFCQKISDDERKGSSMAEASGAIFAERSSAARAILWGGLIAGACDITYAFVFYYL